MKSNPAVYIKMWRSGVENTGGEILDRDYQKLYVTSCHMQTEWFEMFMRGNKLRKVVTRRQNFGMTGHALHALLFILESEWMDTRKKVRKNKRKILVVLIIMSYIGGLCGEEVHLLSLIGMLNFWNDLRQHHIPHVVLTL